MWQIKWIPFFSFTYKLVEIVFCLVHGVNGDDDGNSRFHHKMNGEKYSD